MILSEAAVRLKGFGSTLCTSVAGLETGHRSEDAALLQDERLLGVRELPALHCFPLLQTLAKTDPVWRLQISDVVFATITENSEPRSGLVSIRLPACTPKQSLFPECRRQRSQHEVARANLTQCRHSSSP
jgi:hypothetical protein